MQHRIPDETTETFQVKELLEAVDLRNAMVTAEAVHAQRDTAQYIAAPEEDGGPGRRLFLFVKGNQPSLQRVVFDAIQEDCPCEPGHTELDCGHGRIIRRSIWVTDACRIRRDGYDRSGSLISKEIVHAATSPDEKRASAAGLAELACGQRASNRCTGCATPPTRKTRTPDTPETDPRS
jgi:hypothetical protein